MLDSSELSIRHLAKKPDEKQIPASKGESVRLLKKFHLDLRSVYKIDDAQSSICISRGILSIVLNSR
jgi:hypothetical protein